MSIPKAKRDACATTVASHHATFSDTRAHMEFMENSAQQERDQCHTHFLEEDATWHPMPIATCTRYNQYYKSMDVHWLTRVFVAQFFQSKDEDCAILFTKMAELKEELMEIERLHQLGPRFEMCLFPIPDPTSEM